MAEESKTPASEQDGGAGGEQPIPAPAENPPVTPPTPQTETQGADAAAVDDDGSMTLIAHLTELRSRLIKCLLAVAVGSASDTTSSTTSCTI